MTDENFLFFVKIFGVIGTSSILLLRMGFYENFEIINLNFPGITGVCAV
jgi:hypothetical protein